LFFAAAEEAYAIKIMRKVDLVRKNMAESVTNEKNILAQTNNPFVVRFYYSFQSPENLYLVMEYLKGGDCYSLLQRLGALDEDVAKQYVAETVLALEYCHSNVSCDIAARLLPSTVRICSFSYG
jgi:microtubule-associated serine/threonine kinase